MAVATPFIQATQLAVRAAIGAVAAWLIAERLSLPHPTFALVSTVVVTDLAAERTRQLGGLRMSATLIGAVVGAVLATIAGPRPLIMAIGIATAMLACTLIRAPETAKLGGFVAALVLMTEDGGSWLYAAFRLAETALGIAVAWLLALVPPLIGVHSEPEVEK